MTLETDNGRLHIADRSHIAGSDHISSGILSVSNISDSVTVTVESKSLQFCGRWLINREAFLYELDENTGAVIAGDLLLSGIIANQPVEIDGVIAINIVQPKIKKSFSPDFGFINNNRKPLIFGSIDNIPLLENADLIHTTLKDSAKPGHTSLSLKTTDSWPSSGSVDIDGITYSYTSISDGFLHGVTVTACHNAGTLVAPTGAVTYTLAGHPLIAISKIRSSGVPVAESTIDINAATISFPSIPYIKNIESGQVYEGEFDTVETSNTTTNAANAITTVISTVTSQIGSTPTVATGIGFPGATGISIFPSPSDIYKIISGTYTITFSVSFAGNIGNGSVHFADELVWVLTDGVVTLDLSPSTFSYDAETNELPVIVTASDTSVAISCNITVSSRDVDLGNQDTARYAIMDDLGVLAVERVANEINRGEIKNAALVCQWFVTEIDAYTAGLYIDDVKIADLIADSTSSSTSSLTIDVNTDGDSTVPGNIVNTSLSNAPNKNDVSITVASFVDYVGNGTWRSETQFLTPSNITNGSHSVTVLYETAGINPGVNFVINGVNFTVASPGPKNVTFNSQTAYVATINLGTVNLANMKLPVSINIAYVITPISANSTASISNLTADNLNSNTIINGGNNNIPLDTVAAGSPSLVTTRVPISVSVWNHFQGKKIDVRYDSTSGNSAFGVMRLFYVIEYARTLRTAVTNITATVTGKSGNPADIISYIASKTGQNFTARSYQSLFNWAVANNYLLARYVNQVTDDLTLLSLVAQQTNIFLQGENYVRWLDQTNELTQINLDDIIVPVEYSWSDDIYNDITLVYNTDQVLTATPSNNTTCQALQIQINEIRRIELQARFIHDATVAAQFLSNYVDRFAKMRRLITVELPFDYSELHPGDLISHDHSVYRITTLSTIDSFIKLTAEQII